MMLKLSITVEWDTEDHLTSYATIEIEEEYYSNGKLYFNQMNEIKANRVWNEINRQVSEQVTWMWDVPEWEIVNVEIEV